MFGLSTGEIILIAVVLILLFGAKKIPELAKSLGESVRHLKKGIDGEVEEKKEEAPAAPAQETPAQTEPAAQTTEAPVEEKKEDMTSPAEEVSQEETPKQQN